MRNHSDCRYHEPVMVGEVIEFLRLRPGALIVDATLGGGGHAAAILGAIGSSGLIVGIDRDADAIGEAKRKFEKEENVRIVKGRMGEIAALLKNIGIAKVDGILADLGVSSHQLNRGERGFGFMMDGPLDMRMDCENGETASELLVRLDQDEIEHIIREFGEERYAGRVAAAIKRRAAIDTTRELAEIVAGAVPPHARRGKIHPATRTFMALRIAVNDELGELKGFVAAAPEMLSNGGRLVVISYHSLEDRIVKRRFTELKKAGGYVLPVKKILRPSMEEIMRNPRSRSAKMRVIERTN